MLGLLNLSVFVLAGVRTRCPLSVALFLPALHVFIALISFFV